MSAQQTAPPAASALLTDLYQLTMLQAYFAEKMTETAVFEFFVRHLPRKRNFLIAAGLEQVVEYLERFQVTSSELQWLETTGLFSSDFLRSLGSLRFTGDVHAMPEGTVFFQNEPILRVVAPLPQAQIVETRIINLLQLQTVIASKAVRSAIAAPDKTLVDFGLRRAHGAEAGMLAARACHIAGFSATSNVLAGQLFGIPVSGTMAHSFIQACDSEEEAFLRFARANPGNVVLLIDTYDTEAAAAKVVALAPTLASEGITIRGVRLDSGDLVEHSRRVRKILDEGGLSHVRIAASGSIDEYELARFRQAGAPIDGFGIGTRILTSADAPYLNCAYKLQEYAGRPRLKCSEGKATLPGRKQVYRSWNPLGLMAHDIVSLEGDPQPGEPLLIPVIRDGKRLCDLPSLPRIRARAAEQVSRLPSTVRTLDETESAYGVSISDSLKALAADLTRVSERPNIPMQGG